MGIVTNFNDLSNTIDTKKKKFFVKIGYYDI